MGDRHRVLNILRSLPGRALHVQTDGTLHLGRKYTIYRTNDDGTTCTRVTCIPRGLPRRAAEWSRMACRLLRHEVRALAVLSDGTYVAANRESLFYARPGESIMSPSVVEEDHVRPVPPMCLCVGPNDRVLWGEYTGGDRVRREVRMYVSDDSGRSYSVFHRFEAGSIRHVHNIVCDQSSNYYWVMVGDHGDEPGIGRLSADLKDFEWVVKGDQAYRAVCVFDLGDRLLYGTDTEVEPNAVMCLDKKTGRVERVFEIDGSCIYACRFGSIYAISTTVEPSPVNRSQNAALWVSRDADRWIRVYEAPKDRWSARYFQFGSLVLPRGESDRDAIVFSGQALSGIDGKLLLGTLPGGAL